MPKATRGRVFLSYTHEDLDTVRRIYSGLKERQLNVWFDKEHLAPGRWKTQITKVITQSRYFVICISEAALLATGHDSDRLGFQDTEIQFGYEIAQNQPDKEFTIIPVRLEDCGRGDFRFSSFHQYDLFDNFEGSLDRLAVHLGGVSLADATVQDDRTDGEKKADEILGIANIAYLARDKQKALESLNSSIETFEKFKLDYEIRVKYETRIKVLEAERDILEKHLTMAIKEPRTFIESFEMTRDKYQIQGQVGAVGPEAHAHDINFNQLWNQASSEIDLEQLAEELFNLKTALKKEAEKPEHYRAIAEVAEAETVAKEGNGGKTLEHLKKAGKWALGVAEKIGTSVATTALKSALGL